MRVLAIDYGERRIGLALSDPEGIIATPLPPVPNDKRSIEKIKELVENKNVEYVILGNPLRLSGKEEIQSNKVREFSKVLKEAISCPLELVDERLTTVSASKILHNMGYSPSKSRDKIDSLAAAILLEGFLERRYAPDN